MKTEKQYCSCEEATTKRNCSIIKENGKILRHVIESNISFDRENRIFIISTYIRNYLDDKCKNMLSSKPKYIS